jgi:drug/metabolite transporter (DMT)-like permease
MLNLGLAVALIGMLSFAVSDTFAKSVSVRWGNKRATFALLVLSVLPMVISIPFLGLGGLDGFAIGISALSGVFYMLAYLLMYKSLETEQVANTISLSGIEYAIIALFGILILGEGVTKLDVLCFAGIFIGIFFVTTTAKFRFNRNYFPALLGMVFFGGTYILLDYVSKGSGGLLALLLVNRIVAITLMALYLRIAPERRRIVKNRKTFSMWDSTLMFAVFTGILNGMGAISLLALALLNFVAVGSVIVAAEAAVVIFLGYLIYKEKFERRQIIGFVLLSACVMVLSVL